MNPIISAFLVATAFAYLGAWITSFLLEKPPLDFSSLLQEFGYVLAFLINLGFGVIDFPYPYVYIIMGGLYSIITIMSFTGVQRWLMYHDHSPKTSDVAQIGMALWDLALAVSYFYLYFVGV